MRRAGKQAWMAVQDCIKNHCFACRSICLLLHKLVQQLPIFFFGRAGSSAEALPLQLRMPLLKGIPEEWWLRQNGTCTCFYLRKSNQCDDSKARHCAMQWSKTLRQAQRVFVCTASQGRRGKCADPTGIQLYSTGLSATVHGCVKSQDIEEVLRVRASNCSINCTPAWLGQEHDLPL